MRIILVSVAILMGLLVVVLGSTTMDAMIMFNRAAAEEKAAHDRDDLHGMQEAYAHECHAHAMMLFVTADDMKKLHCPGY
jgi:hypothetical protein